ncbi:reverse transcriptase domain-containing protein [Tanacetum coccineum]
MNPNESDEERNNLSEVDDKTDVYFMMQAYEYHEGLRQEETQPRLTRNPIHRDREGVEEHLMSDYFDDHSDPLPKHFKFFKVRTDAMGRMSLSIIMKCTAAIHQLAYGNTPDAFDEYLQMRMLGSIDCANNDINVLDNSSLFEDLLEEIAPTAPFVVNGVEFENRFEDEDEDKDEIKGLMWVNNDIANKRGKSGHM